jgi:copper chaperone CopZ
MKRVLINNMMCDNCVHFVKKSLTKAGGNVTGAVVGEVFVDRLSDDQIRKAVEEDDIYKVREIREVK